MTNKHNYLAFDLGAESGRAIIGTLADGKLDLTELHRFTNAPIMMPDGLHWDVQRLWSEIKSGISKTVLKFDGTLEGIGLDGWGVDFALLDEKDSLLSTPFHYRDSRTDGMLDEAFRRMPRETIFDQTGLQFMQINTLYQLLAMVIGQSPLLNEARRLISIPDLFNYWLCGQLANEFTEATTTQCYDPNKRDWAFPVLEALGIPTHLFHPVTQPGTVLGNLLRNTTPETEKLSIPVIAPACHDTASAVVAIPAEVKDFVWISSGTWSIIGTEVKKPDFSPTTSTYNFTNEGGVFNTWRLSKNMMGLWLVQECRRAWQQNGENLSYDTLTNQASEARPFLAVIDPDDPKFLHSGNMPERIRQYCESSGQPVPGSRGEIIRVILESMALKYRWVIDRLETITRKQLSEIYIVGGGSKNQLLNQFTADATNCTCIAGPVEATAAGNILMQSMALGHIDSLADARAVVRRSFDPKIYAPDRSTRLSWDASYSKMEKVIKKVGSYLPLNG
jgi:rhamnulokinase